MTANDLKVSAKRLRNDAEQLRGRQRSILKLGRGELKPKWQPEHDALELAARHLEASADGLDAQAKSLTAQEEPAHVS